MWDIADSTIMRQWKWPFVNGGESRALTSNATEFLNSCQDGTNPAMYLGITSKNDSARHYMSYS